VEAQASSFFLAKNFCSQTFYLDKQKATGKIRGSLPVIKLENICKSEKMIKNL